MGAYVPLTKLLLFAQQITVNLTVTKNAEEQELVPVKVGKNNFFFVLFLAPNPGCKQ